MSAKPRPNVLIIHTDQHRFDCLGVCGNRDIRTPNIDALAADGTNYRNSFCSFPVCTPSRYSLITGLYVRQHGGWSNHCTLPAGMDTLPKALRRAGYRTQAVGKMHFTPTYADVGFDEMELSEQHGPGRWDDDYHRELRRRGLADRVDLLDQEQEWRDQAPPAYFDCFGAGESDLPEEMHSTTWIGDRAVEALNGWTGGGNCLMAGFIKPHHPFDPPARWSRMYDPAKLSPLPGWLDEPLPRDLARQRGYFDDASLTTDRLRHMMAMYYATISQIDRHVGRMLGALKDRGLYGDTMIVFTSDHGDYLGFHHMALKGGFMYDPLVKVPLIIKWAGRSSFCSTGVPPVGKTGILPVAWAAKGTGTFSNTENEPVPFAAGGRVSDALVSNVDVATTILATVGLDRVDGMTGLDLGACPDGREFVFADGARGREVMVRSRTHKLLLSDRPDESLLFDLAADPMEMSNVIAHPAHQADLSALTKALTRWAVFDAIAPTHLDEHAAIIAAPNAHAFDPARRADMQNYFRETMRGAGEALFS